jgi:hypothetical protein
MEIEFRAGESGVSQPALINLIQFFVHVRHPSGL